MATDSLPPLSRPVPHDGSPDDPAERRSVLATTPNPEPRLDYLVTLDAPRAPTALRLRYVPDRQILQTEAWATYATARVGSGLPLEALAAQVLSDVANELVPRWLEVRLDRAESGQSVVMQERQPQWAGHALPALLTGAGDRA